MLMQRENHMRFFHGLAHGLLSACLLGAAMLPAGCKDIESGRNQTPPPPVAPSVEVAPSVKPDTKPRNGNGNGNGNGDSDSDSAERNVVAAAPASPRPPAELARLANFIVCIDPGHPSETSAGAEAHGLSENRLNWQVALQLRERLEARGIHVILTKQSEGQMVTNRRRAEIANRAGAALFLRLHCDEGSGHGFTWYYPDSSGTKDGVTGPPPEVQRDSREAAQTINAAMIPLLSGHLEDNSVKTDAATFVGGKQGGVLTGSVFARVPTALIEMCYINQKSDAQFIASEAGRQKMAEALAVGIETYLMKRAEHEPA